MLSPLQREALESLLRAQGRSGPSYAPLHGVALVRFGSPSYAAGHRGGAGTVGLMRHTFRSLVRRGLVEVVSDTPLLLVRVTRAGRQQVE